MLRSQRFFQRSFKINSILFLVNFKSNIDSKIYNNIDISSEFKTGTIFSHPLYFLSICLN